MIGYVCCVESSIFEKSVFSEDVAYFRRLTVQLAKKFPISYPPFCGCPFFWTSHIILVPFIVFGRAIESPFFILFHIIFWTCGSF